MTIFDKDPLTREWNAGGVSKMAILD